jgi:hypothetical protein
MIGFGRYMAQRATITLGSHRCPCRRARSSAQPAANSRRPQPDHTLARFSSQPDREPARFSSQPDREPARFSSQPGRKPALSLGAVERQAREVFPATVRHGT